MKTVEKTSLLPYLSSSVQGIHLDVLYPENQRDKNDRLPFPFPLADDTSPFSQIVKGCVRAEDGAEIRAVFLLMQKSDYRVAGCEYHRLNNRSVEDAWLNTGLYHARASARGRALLPGKVEDAGEFGFRQFKPLFYCRRQSVFFHPSCPLCGDELELLTDDAVLEDNGLRPYSDSLKRYLYCSNCIGNNIKEVYAFEISPEDPRTVKDRWELVKSFGRLKGNVEAPYDFPCNACSDFESCYVTGCESTSRIAFFSFYPFYMLVFDAVPFRAEEILPRLSGAGEKPFCDTEEGGKSPIVPPESDKESSVGKNGFFHVDDERLFMEILYVKLSFLRKVAEKVVDRNGAAFYPGMIPSMNSIWVWPGEEGSIAPSSWNFSVEIIDLIMAPSLFSYTPVLSGICENHFLSSVWFHTLLVNANQSFADIFPVVVNISENQGDSEESGRALNEIMRNTPMLSVKNIFWNPMPVSAPEEWEKIWFRALETGFSLMGGLLWEKGCRHSCRLLDDVEDMCREIRGILFPLPSAGPVDEKASEDRAISGILFRLADKLRKAVEADKTVEDTGESLQGPADTGSCAVDNNDPADDIYETVVLTSSPEEVDSRGGERGDTAVTPPRSKTGAGDGRDDESGGTEVIPPRSKPGAGDGWDDEGGGTEVIPPRSKTGAGGGWDEESGGTEVIPPRSKTGAGDGRDDESGGTEVIPPRSKTGAGDGRDDEGADNSWLDTDKTVCIPPGEDTGGHTRQEEGEDDMTDDTLKIDTRKNRDEG